MALRITYTRHGAVTWPGTRRIQFSTAPIHQRRTTNDTNKDNVDHIIADEKHPRSRLFRVAASPLHYRRPHNVPLPPMTTRRGPLKKKRKPIRVFQTPSVNVVATANASAVLPIALKTALPDNDAVQTVKKSSQCPTTRNVNVGAATTGAAAAACATHETTMKTAVQCENDYDASWQRLSLEERRQVDYWRYLVDAEANEISGRFSSALAQDSPLSSSRAVDSLSTKTDETPRGSRVPTMDEMEADLIAMILSPPSSPKSVVHAPPPQLAIRPTRPLPPRQKWTMTPFDNTTVSNNFQHVDFPRNATGRFFVTMAGGGGGGGGGGSSNTDTSAASVECIGGGGGGGAAFHGMLIDITSGTQRHLPLHPSLPRVQVKIGSGGFGGGPGQVGFAGGASVLQVVEKQSDRVIFSLEALGGIGGAPPESSIVNVKKEDDRAVDPTSPLRPSLTNEEHFRQDSGSIRSISFEESRPATPIQDHINRASSNQKELPSSPTCLSPRLSSSLRSSIPLVMLNVNDYSSSSSSLSSSPPCLFTHGSHVGPSGNEASAESEFIPPHKKEETERVTTEKESVHNVVEWHHGRGGRGGTAMASPRPFAPMNIQVAQGAKGGKPTAPHGCPSKAKVFGLANNDLFSSTFAMGGSGGACGPDGHPGSGCYLHSSPICVSPSESRTVTVDAAATDADIIERVHAVGLGGLSALQHLSALNGNLTFQMLTYFSTHGGTGGHGCTWGKAGRAGQSGGVVLFIEVEENQGEDEDEKVLDKPEFADSEASMNEKPPARKFTHYA